MFGPENNGGPVIACATSTVVTAEIPSGHTLYMSLHEAQEGMQFRYSPCCNSCAVFQFIISTDVSQTVNTQSKSKMAVASKQTHQQITG